MLQVRYGPYTELINGVVLPCTAILNSGPFQVPGTFTSGWARYIIEIGCEDHNQRPYSLCEPQLTGNGLTSDAFSFFLVEVGSAAFSSSVIVLRLEDPPAEDEGEGIDRLFGEDDDGLVDEEEEDEGDFDEKELEDGFEDDEDGNLGSVTDFDKDSRDSGPSGPSTSVYSSIINRRNPSNARNPIV
ncbi:hypothetical protein QFC22_006508 [Naganishia vaughanmartiniae]|uniref:Uncharacterized protein n=1 Tax=Naganishia vaughanmartiniae TaxID=1424756 RepID=A0ACC2WK59_9TREE|nr:hypothetical protein QFC22_006508 [Naganishia vaughanmartiniae]